MASVNVQVPLLDVLRATLDVTMIHFNVATVSVSLGTLFVTRIKIVTMDLMKNNATNKVVQKKLSNVTMVHVYHDPLSAMDDGNVLMDLMKRDVTKVSRVTRNPSDVNLDSVYLNTLSVTLSLIVLMVPMKSTPFVNTVSTHLS